MFKGWSVNVIMALVFLLISHPSEVFKVKLIIVIWLLVTTVCSKAGGKLERMSGCGKMER